MYFLNLCVHKKLPPNSKGPQFPPLLKMQFLKKSPLWLNCFLLFASCLIAVNSNLSLLECYDLAQCGQITFEMVTEFW